MEYLTDFIAIPSIVVVAYFVGLMVKTMCSSKKTEKFIPIICGCVGVIIALVLYFTTPEWIPADNWVSATAIGIVSGLSATGANQIYKQLSR